MVSNDEVFSGPANGDASPRSGLAEAAGAAGASNAGGMGDAAADASRDEQEHWRGNYQREPYYRSGRGFDDYAPAYSLGSAGYSEYGGAFGESESLLESRWESTRGASALSWPEASAASRAAWERSSSASHAGSTGETATTGADAMDQRELAALLNDLIAISRDGEYGFRECARHVKSSDIKALLNRRADDCIGAATELQRLVTQLGRAPDDGGTAGGAVHRGWVAVRSALTGYSDLAMLDECERGEDTATAHYRKALKQNLPVAIRTVVERQAEGAQRNHDQIKALRDSVRNSPQSDA